MMIIVNIIVIAKTISLKYLKRNTINIPKSEWRSFFIFIMSVERQDKL